MPILTICKHKMQVFQQGSWDQRLKLCCKFCSSTNSLGQDNPRSKQQAKQLTNETRNIKHIGHIILQAGAGAAKRATRPSILSKLAAVEKGKNQRTWFHWTMMHMNSAQWFCSSFVVSRSIHGDVSKCRTFVATCKQHSHSWESGIQDANHNKYCHYNSFRR